MAGGWSQAGGFIVRGEIGALIGQHVAGFLYGDWSSLRGASAGAGVRVTW